MSTGTVQLLAPNADDTTSCLQTLPFDFYLMGIRYTQFSVNDNGLMRLGPIVVQGGSPYQPFGQAGIPLITAYGADQRTHIGDGKVHFKSTGSVPNRVMTVEWLNMQANFNAGGTADLTYQVRLYETTGAIEFVYGTMTKSTLGAADVDSQDPHIGFSSTNAANRVGSVLAPQSGTPAPTYATTASAAAAAAANLYTAGPITVLSSAAQGARRIFAFTPPTPAAPTDLTFSAVTHTSMQLNWVDSPNETIYSNYRSLDGINYTFFTNADEKATSFSVTGLQINTTYYWQLYAISEGAFSASLTVSQPTLPPGNIISTAVGGNWGSATTWQGGVVPEPGDHVTIASGALVIMDSAFSAYSLTI